MSEAEATSDDGTDTATPLTAAPEATEKTYSQKYVNQLRDEAARYRTEKNSAVDAAKESVTQQWQTKFESETTRLSNDLGDAWVHAGKLHAAIEAFDPDAKAVAFASALRGQDEDSIKASAESLKKLFGTATPPKATDPTQGSSSHAPLNGHPLLEKLQAIVGPPRS
jgi:hypothetical protein